jgi:hypothetical protein
MLHGSWTASWTNPIRTPSTSIQFCGFSPFPGVHPSGTAYLTRALVVFSELARYVILSELSAAAGADCDARPGAWCRDGGLWEHETSELIAMQDKTVPALRRKIQAFPERKLLPSGACARRKALILASV